MTDDDAVDQVGLSRRALLRRGAAVGAAAWVVPLVQVVSMTPAHADTPSAPVGMPEPRGGTVPTDPVDLGEPTADPTPRSDTHAGPSARQSGPRSGTTHGVQARGAAAQPAVQTKAIQDSGSLAYTG